MNGDLLASAKSNLDYIERRYLRCDHNRFAHP